MNDETMQDPDAGNDLLAGMIDVQQKTARSGGDTPPGPTTGEVPMGKTDSRLSARAPLNTYAELVRVIANAPVVLHETRRVRAASLRDVSAATGVNFSTLSRFERGGNMHTDHLVAVLRWIGGA